MIRKILSLMFMLLFASSLFGNIVKLNRLENPSEMKIGNDYIYISDNATIKVFSTKNIKYIKTIGRKGNGPKEFDYSPRLQPLENGIFAYIVNRIYLIDKLGNFLKEKKLRTMYNDLKKIDNRFIGAKTTRKPDDLYLEYFFLNNKFEVQNRIYSHKWSNHIDGTRELFYASFFGVNKNKIIFIGDKNKFKIEIMESHGNLEKTIQKKTTLIPFNEKDKQEFFKMWEKQKIDIEFQKKIIRFPKYLPAIYSVKFSENKIYVFTYKQNNGKRECYIYNLKGIFLKRSFIPLKSDSITDQLIFSIRDNKIYQLIDNEDDETWNLHIKLYVP